MVLVLLTLFAAFAQDPEGHEAASPTHVDEPTETPDAPWGTPEAEPVATPAVAPEPELHFDPAPEPITVTDTVTAAVPEPAHLQEPAPKASPSPPPEPVVHPPTPEPVAPSAAPHTTVAQPELPYPFDMRWTAPATPMWTPPAAAPATSDAPTASALQSYLLPLPERGISTILRLAFWLLLCAVASRQLERARKYLLPVGLFPAAVALSVQAVRLIAIMLGLLLVAAVLPPALLPIVPIAVLGGAIAVGLSVWTVLPDLWAGVMLTVERRIEPGQWLNAGEVSGEVQNIGIRSTQLADRDGRTVVVPNRLLVRVPVASDTTNWPPVDIAMPIPESLSTEQVRAVLSEAVLLSPYLAPAEEPVLVQTQFHPPIWRVRTRIVEAHWADEFEGALRERVRELLERL